MPDSNDDISKALSTLNDLFRIDPRAIKDLVEHRVSCSQGLAHHRTAQVVLGDDGYPRIGLLGVINALFGVDPRGSGYIAAQYDSTGKFTGFVRTRLTNPA